MKLPMSNRLLACCSYVNQGARVADIGCDHGYLGIYLLRQGIAESVYAADIREKPLQSAVRNAAACGVEARMRFFLSDGVRALPRDFDTLVCAGMGADSMISVLSAAPWLQNPRYRLILQCQSRRQALARYLSGAGYRVTRETIAQDGKFYYPVMEIVYAPAPPLTDAQCYISPALLESGCPLLPAYYDWMRGHLRACAEALRSAGDAEKLPYYDRVLKELSEMEDTVYANRR